SAWPWRVAWARPAPGGSAPQAAARRRWEAQVLTAAGARDGPQAARSHAGSALWARTRLACRARRPAALAAPTPGPGAGRAAALGGRRARPLPRFGWGPTWVVMAVRPAPGRPGLAGLQESFPARSAALAARCRSLREAPAGIPRGAARST